MSSPELTIPDPTPWLVALAPEEKRDAVLAWREWLSSFVWLGETEWNERSRKQALDAIKNGRTPRVPCGVHPGGFDSVSVEPWYAWATLPSEHRLDWGQWKGLPGGWVRGSLSELGLKGSWRHQHIDAGLGAFFLMMRLDILSNPGIETRLNPLLRVSDTPSERRKMVWRECVRIRQHLADMVPLAQDLPRASRRHFKAWWFASLEWTRLAEKAGELLWLESVVFNRSSRIHIAWQRWFGKLAFR